MSSSVNNSDSSTSILSIKEIIGIIIVFSLLLYLLFPKNDIDEIIESKGKNTNLSINYIESMLLYYPDNIKLKMLLLRNYESSGKSKKALKLISKLLKETKDREILDELYRSEYLLIKERYFKKKSNKLLKEISDKLHNYFEFKGESRDYMFFLGEATQMDFPKLKYIALKGLMKQKPEIVDFAITQEAYYLALSLNYKDEAEDYLLKLITYKEADDNLKDNVLSILLSKQQYAKAIELSTKLFSDSKEPKDKENYFNIALYASALQSTDNNRSNIKNLIDLYESSQEMRGYNISYILDNLLKMGYIKEASRFAKKSFKKYSDRYDENTTTLSINSLVYNEELEPAREIALFAESKFNRQKWLDKAIQFSIWQGKMREAIVLNEKGLAKYKDKKYEKYLKDRTTIHTAYNTLGKIYKQNLNMKKIEEYYNYIGKPQEAERFFEKLYKKKRTKERLKYLTLFCYKNHHYKKAINLYKRYRFKYGVDRTLHQKTIEALTALKRFKESYNMLKNLEKLDKSFNLKQLIDLAWIFKDYKYLYKLLWREEGYHGLEFDNYNRLIILERELNRGERLPYLYKRLWRKTKNEIYLKDLLYLYAQKEKFKEFKSLFDSMSIKMRRELKKDTNFNLILANYYIYNSQYREALKIFKSIIKKEPKNIIVHQAYLWTILDNDLTKELKKEIRLLRKKPKLQKGVGFPSVVGALQLQNSDLALRWLKPLLKSSKNNLEYQIVYSDILQVQDRENGASKVRLKLFKKLNKMIKRDPKLLKDKAFARVYLRLVVLYTTPYEKKNIYFKKFKSLFKEKDFMEIKIGWKSYMQSDADVKYLATKYKMNLPWLNIYLSISQDNDYLKQKILKGDKDVLPFRDRVTIAKDIGDRAGAYSLAFQGLEDNSRDTDLYKIYEGMVNSDYPKSQVRSEYKRLSKDILAIKQRVSYRWHLYKGVKSKLSFDQYRYIDNRKKDFLDTKMGISISNSHKHLIWNFEIAKHFAQKDFISSLLDIDYTNSEVEIKLEAKYQNKTVKTTQLQMIGIQDSVKVSATKRLTNSIQVGVSYENIRYKEQSGGSVGSSEEIKVSTSYLLRAGYPDIRFNTYLLINRFRDVKRDLLPKNYIELGSQVSVGTVGNEDIHNDWRPFGVVGLSINDRRDIGTSLSLGVSGELIGADALNFSIDYSKGMDMISYPYYGFTLNYMF